MILFKPEHAPKILDGSKTQTRRLWQKCRVRVGAIHQCYTRPAFVKKNPGKPFAAVEIIAVRPERLGVVSQADARREGYPSRNAYLKAFAVINKLRPETVANLMVWVVDFRLAETTSA